jgi:hypothetical protein
MQCGSTFTARRSDARYCSNACRQKAYRRQSLPNALQDIVSQLRLLAFRMAALGEFVDDNMGIGLTYEWEWVVTHVSNEANKLERSADYIAKMLAKSIEQN